MKIRFSEDKFYNGQLLYPKNVVHEIPEELGQAARWLKRGGVEVKEETKVVVKEEIKEEIKEEKKVEVSHESKKAKNKKILGL